MASKLLIIEMPMSCRTTSSSARLFTTAFLAALLHASIWPQAAALLPTHAEPRFYIQAIEVTGARHVSTAVVASESLLRSGQVYTESELRDAVGRIRRLPFVLEADFALEKGRERGTYVLRVDVVETRRFFYQLGLGQSRFSEPLAFGSATAADDNLASTALAGARLFLGRYGLLFAAAGSAGTQVGYTRYNLFGKNAVLHLGLSKDRCCATSVAHLGLDPAFASWVDEDDATSATLTLGVPLSVHQSVRGSVAWRDSGAGFRRPTAGSAPGDRLDYKNRIEEEIRLAWSYDTTDDPVFPRHGMSLVMALDHRTLEAQLASGAATETRSELLRFSVLGRRHWPVARRHSFAAGLALEAGRSNVENLPLSSRELRREALDTWGVSATIRHSMRLHEAKKAQAYRQVYWQNRADYSWNGTSPDFDLAYNSLDVAALSSALVIRSTWGILRLGLRWIQVGDLL